MAARTVGLGSRTAGIAARDFSVPGQGRALSVQGVQSGGDSLAVELLDLVAEVAGLL